MTLRARLGVHGLEPTAVCKRSWAAQGSQPAVAQPPAPAALEASLTLAHLEQAEPSEAVATVHEVVGAPLNSAAAVCMVPSPQAALNAAPSSTALVVSPSTALVASPSTTLATMEPPVTTLVAAGPPTMTMVAIPPLNVTGFVRVGDEGSQAVLALAPTADVTLHSLAVPSGTAIALASAAAGSQLDGELDGELDTFGEPMALDMRMYLGLLTCNAAAAVIDGRESRASEHTQTYAEPLSATPPEVSAGAVGTNDPDGTVHSPAGGIDANDSDTNGCDADIECSAEATPVDNNRVEATDIKSDHQVEPTQLESTDEGAAAATQLESDNEVVATQLEREDEQLNESDGMMATKGDVLRAVSHAISPQTTAPTTVPHSMPSAVPVAVVGTVVNKVPLEQETTTTTVTTTTTTMTTIMTTVHRLKRKASELAAVLVKQQVQGGNDGVLEAIHEAERHELERVTAEMSERMKAKFKRAQAKWHPDSDIEDGEEADRDEDYSAKSKVRRPKRQRRIQAGSIVTSSHLVMTNSAASSYGTRDAPIDLTAD